MRRRRSGGIRAGSHLEKYATNALKPVWSVSVRGGQLPVSNGNPRTVKGIDQKIDNHDSDKDNGPIFNDFYCDHIWTNLAGCSIFIIELSVKRHHTRWDGA
jgi:hypothetical protein